MDGDSEEREGKEYIDGDREERVQGWSSAGRESAGRECRDGAEMEQRRERGSAWMETVKRERECMDGDRERECTDGDSEGVHGWKQ